MYRKVANDATYIYYYIQKYNELCKKNKKFVIVVILFKNI